MFLCLDSLDVESPVLVCGQAALDEFLFLVEDGLQSVQFRGQAGVGLCEVSELVSYCLVVMDLHCQVPVEVHESELHGLAFLLSGLYFVFERLYAVLVGLNVHWLCGGGGRSILE